MGDIDYFSEQRMKEYSAVRFHSNLPNDRLKNLFKEAMSGYINWHGDISADDLEHYKQTENNAGVKTIEFRYYKLTHTPLIPLITTMLLLTTREIGPMAFMYFDTATGEMLSKTEAESRREKNKIAEKHFEAGQTFESEEKYQQAFEEFHMAYSACSLGYKNEKKILQHLNRAMDEVDSDALLNVGEQLLLRGDLTSALDKFQDAANKTHTRKQSILHKIEPEKNKLAEKHFEKGNTFESYGNFKSAFEEYEKAYQECTKNYKNAEKFLKYRNQAKNEFDADKLRKEGEQKLAQGDLQSALNKFQKALDITKVNEYQMNNKIEFVKNEISAETTKKQGDDLFIKGKYGRALEKYTSAFEMSQDQNLKAIYKALLEKAEDELHAIDDLQKGNVAFEDGNYVKAKDYFSKAQSGTECQKTKETSEELLDLANTEIEAMKIHQNAQKFLNDNDYEKAMVLLKSAVSKSQHQLNRQKLQTELDLVRNELDIKEIVLEAIQFFDQRKYVEATKMYEEARNKVTQEERQEKLEILQQQCSNEAKAQKLAKEGDELHKQSKLLQALEKYQKALEISSVETEKCAYATLVIKVQEEVKQDLIKRADETFDKFNEETNVVIEKVYQLISGFKDCPAVTQTSTFIEDLRKHFDSCIHQLDSIQTEVGTQNKPGFIGETPKKELLELIDFRIKDGSFNELQKASNSILKLLSADSDKTFIKLKSLLVAFDKIKGNNEVMELKQKFRDQFQTYFEQINSIQTVASSNRPDLTSHYEARANKQADEQQETVRMLNNQ